MAVLKIQPEKQNSWGYLPTSVRAVAPEPEKQDLTGENQHVNIFASVLAGPFVCVYSVMVLFSFHHFVCPFLSCFLNMDNCQVTVGNISLLSKRARGSVRGGKLLCA